MFQIEAMDGQDLPKEVLAVASDASTARAAFDEAIKRRPGDKLRLRHGARVIAQTKLAVLDKSWA